MEHQQQDSRPLPTPRPALDTAWNFPVQAPLVTTPGPEYTRDSDMHTPVKLYAESSMPLEQQELRSPYLGINEHQQRLKRKARGADGKLFQKLPLIARAAPASETTSSHLNTKFIALCPLETAPAIEVSSRHVENCFFALSSPATAPTSEVASSLVNAIPVALCLPASAT
ncbi:hypothetical protein BDV96DRAFT_647199 [Lophiotrema nucula]|uniref:Uncharacterized protein n=1 Tax=Lophiotrema nucula TaxID=690887 RepID=A0A6A5Z568_9PLEO|nr:hypothetical protein BDV96DRAFT_647199 [Lophiotrema nucula]